MIPLHGQSLGLPLGCPLTSCISLSMKKGNMIDNDTNLVDQTKPTPVIGQPYGALAEFDEFFIAVMSSCLLGTLIRFMFSPVVVVFHPTHDAFIHEYTHCAGYWLDKIIGVGFFPLCSG